MNIHNVIAKAKEARMKGGYGSEKMLDELEAEGSRLIEKANSTRDTDNISFNLHDAYGYAVYYKGVLMRSGFLKGGVLSKSVHKGWLKRNYPSGTGRDYAANVLNGYTPPPTGYALIVFNAAYYSEILEDGKQDGGKGLAKRYKIISQINGDVEQLAKKYGGTYQLHNSKG